MFKQRELVQWVMQLRYNDIPLPVIEKAKEVALHGWGVQLAASTLPWSKVVYRYVASEGGAPKSTVVNYGLKTSASNAAFANGCFGHGFEMDDNHHKVSVKGGCVVVPAALAIGEQQFSSGKDMIVAMVAGYEIMVRIAFAVYSAVAKRSFQATGLFGPFGSAMAVAKLLALPEDAMVHALGLAAVHGSGIEERPMSGRGHMKRHFGGIAAAGGMQAALLAREGLTGPETMLEEGAGFCRAFGDPGIPMHLLTKGLGTEWEIMHAHYKIYAQDGFIQPMTEAMERIVKAHSFRPEDIEEVRVGTSKMARDGTVGLIREPKELTSAQYSANFSLALFLLKGGAMIQEYTEESLSDPEVARLGKRIFLDIDDEIEAEYQKRRPRGARVTVRLKSGQVFTEKVDDLRSLSGAEVEDKFRKLSNLVLDPQRTEQLLVVVKHLEDVRDVSRLAPMLVRQDSDDWLSGARTDRAPASTRQSTLA